MDQKILLYSPCDGEIIKLEDLNDGVFSKNTLGFGFAIKPTSNDLYSCFESAYIDEISSKKHSFKLKSGTNILFIHIGLESFKLNGKPFNYSKNVGEKIKKEDKIVSIDWTLFAENKEIQKVIPITLEPKNESGYEIQNIKYGKVKTGDLIGELVLNIKNEIDKFKELVSKKGKYEKVVEEIYTNVGTNLNFSKFYNCVTRFRLVIKDKSLVNENEIKKISIVKGIKWNGNELQIIIGGEVYKVRDAFEEYVNLNSNLSNEIKQEKKFIAKTNRSFKDKLLAAVTGIIIPALPVIMAAGILKAIQAMLTQAGVLEQVNLGTGEGQLPNIASYDIYTGIVYIIAEAGLSFMGIYFCYNTVKFLGGNEVMGIFVGLALVCPFLYDNGAWLNFKLFSLGDIDIAIKGYQSSIIPQICAGLLFFYIDKWAQKWIPTSIDIVLRPAFSFLLTMLLSFVVVGPIMGIIESGVYSAVTFLNDIPYGIGVGIFTLLWQPLVLTGMHYPIIMPIMLDQAANDTTSTILVGTTIGVLGQAGAALAIVLRTKNAQTKSIGIGSLPAAFFGVTEPAIYGVTLPKFWPFIWGCVGAGMAGFLSGLFNVVSYAGATPSMGLIFVVGFVRGGWENIALGCLVLALAAVFSFTFVMLTFRDRPNEIKAIKSVNHTIARIFNKKTNNKFNNSEYKKELENILQILTKEKMNFIKETDKNFSIIEKLEVKIELLKTKEEKEKEAKLIKIKKAILKEDVNKLNNLKMKYDSINYQDKIIELNSLRTKYLLEREPLLEKLDQLQESILNNTNLLLDKISEEIDYANLKDLQINYYNAIHSLDIAYGLTEKQDIKLTNKDIMKIGKIN